MVTPTPVTEYVVNVNSLNVREEPTTSSAVIGTLPLGAVVATDGYTTDGIYHWRRRVDFGYVAEYNLNGLGTPFMVLRQDGWKTELLQRITAMEVTLQEMRQLVESR